MTLVFLLALAASIAITPATATAQDPTDPVSADGWGFFQAGLLALDVDAFNASLVSAGLPELGGSPFTLGGAGYGRRGSVLFGFEGHGILGDTEAAADGSYEVSLSGGYGLFRVGWLAVPGPGFAVYPTVGIGGGSISVNIRERSVPLFDDILTDPGRSSSLSAGMFLLDLGVAAEYRARIEDDEEDEDDEGAGGLVFGIQGGYTFAPGSPSWTLDDINRVAGGPELLLQGLYVRASIGFWGGGRDEDGS